MWPLIAAGAGLGTFKYFTHDKPEQEKLQRINAAMELGSPWTGQHGRYTPSADLMGNIMAGGTTGALMGSNLESAQAENALKLQEAEALKSQYPAAQPPQVVSANPGVSGNRAPASMYGRVAAYSDPDNSYRNRDNALLNSFIARRSGGGG